jgi:hypothetical protein
MTATARPDIGPGPRPATRDFFDRLPRRARGLSRAEQRVYLEVVGHLDEEGCYGRTNQEGGRSVGMHPSNFGAIIGRLGRENPAGLDHPYWEVSGGTRRRRVRPLLLPKDAPNKQPAIRMRQHSNPGPIRMRQHSNPTTERPETAGVAAYGPRLRQQTKPENHVDVILQPPTTLACEREHGPARPVAGPDPPAGPASVAAPLADGVDRELAAMTTEQLREHIAAMEARKAELAGPRRPVGDVIERTMLTGRAIEARALLGAREGPQEPRMTPKVRSFDPTASVAPAAKPAAPAPHVETPDLIRRLISPSGPDQVEAIVRRLNERLDPEFEPLYRRCCADVLAGRLDVGAMIGGFRWALNGPGRGVKKGPSFSAYITRHRETRQRERPPAHRRE